MLEEQARWRLVARPRRMRAGPAVRGMVREASVTAEHLVQPLFVQEAGGVRTPLESMPGVHRHPVGDVGEEARRLGDAGVAAVLLFGIPRGKDGDAAGACHADGVIQRALRAIRREAPDLLVWTDVCLCEYTDHGHCGVIRDGGVDNDATLDLLARTAVSHAEAGADFVAPSAMMDGQVAAIRAALDDAGRTDVGIVSYAAKYASAFYGPFRDAAGSTPQFGDRRGYQMDPANAREALREIAQDVQEGADAVLVKPALAYLDVIRAARDRFDTPMGAFHVSGEYAMLKAAAQRGWIHEDDAVMETLTGIRRAGADFVITYYAEHAARLLKEGFQA